MGSPPTPLPQPNLTPGAGARPRRGRQWRRSGQRELARSDPNVGVRGAAAKVRPGPDPAGARHVPRPPRRLVRAPPAARSARCRHEPAPAGRWPPRRAPQRGIRPSRGVARRVALRAMAKLVGRTHGATGQGQDGEPAEPPARPAYHSPPPGTCAREDNRGTPWATPPSELRRRQPPAWRPPDATPTRHDVRATERRIL